jgi:NAD(P)-dependent dehydrogenase (short-subunit alcohol dehydrogenase family)
VDALPLAGRTALVTGASRGIGAATARALDDAGARVALVARSETDLRELSKELTNESFVFVADLSDSAAPSTLAGEVLEQLGGIDVLVNNAGIGVRVAVEELDAALIDEMYAVNVRAPLLLISGLAPSMRERGRGSIVNISSIAGIVGTPRRAAYAATKGALDAATRSLALELGPAGIRVNAVAPGVVDTALWAKNKAIPGVVEQVEQQTPLRRWALPSDIADAVVFLASDAARFVTGETLSVDGGMARTFDLYSGPI